MWRWIILCCMFRAVSGQCCNCAPNSLSTTQCYAFWFIDCATTCTAQSQYQACINGNPNYQTHNLIQQDTLVHRITMFYQRVRALSVELATIR